MSGDYLRHCAQQGESHQLRSILKNRGNPCSQDEFGLTALMYAVWNGHVECVKYLITNDFGVDKDGIKTTSLNLQSCKGFTALHLAALDCPKWVSKEITTLLLLAGVDKSILDNEGCTAEQLCPKFSNWPAQQAFDDFRSEDETMKNSLQEMVDTVFRKYQFLHPPSVEVDVESLDKIFPVPHFLTQKQKAGSIPDGLLIHEHQIEPLVEKGVDMKGVDGFKCLGFTKDQGISNLDRREKLLRSSDTDFKPVTYDEIDAFKRMDLGRRRKKR